MSQRTRDPEPPEKPCTKCGVVKPLSEFYFHGQNGRHRPDCKDCVNAQGKARYDADPELKLVANKQWREQHPEKMREYTAKSVRRFAPGGYRHRMSHEEYEQRWQEQDGKCYLCGKPLDELDRICIEHDHRCCGPDRSCEMCRRGLACNPCNAIVGLAGEDPDALRRIADALEIARLKVTQKIAEFGAGQDSWTDSRIKYETAEEVREAQREAVRRYAERKRDELRANDEYKPPCKERTECPAGHPYDEQNTRYDKNGYRKCRECARIRQREYARVNADKIRARQQRPENKERANARRRELRQQNGEKMRAQERQSYRADPEPKRESQRQYNVRKRQSVSSLGEGALS